MTLQQSPEPIYQQVAALLLREIMAGRLADGQRLAPERELAAELSISVGTLRKALKLLEAEGRLERIQGSGNYVRASEDISGIYAFFRLERLQGGGVPSARVLAVDRLSKPADLPAFGRGSEAWRIRRLRFLDEVPAALEEIWLDGALAQSLDPAELTGALYLHYRQKLGLWITRAEDRVSTGRVPDWVVPEFERPPGEDCGYIERTSWGQDGQAAEVSRNWFNPATACYVQRLG